MKILFVCTGNSCRSPMAKAYLEKRLEESGRSGIEVYSAGLAPSMGMKATEEAKQIIAKEGGDISGHFARKVTDLRAQEADLIFVMENKHKQYMISKYPKAAKKIYLLKDFEKIGSFKVTDDPDIRDPMGKDIEFYKEIFAIIKESVERILKEI